MSKVNKKKNGFRIVVENWGNTVMVFNSKNEKVSEQVFSDHIKAVLVANAI